MNKCKLQFNSHLGSSDPGAILMKSHCQFAVQAHIYLDWALSAACIRLPSVSQLCSEHKIKSVQFSGRKPVPPASGPVKTASRSSSGISPSPVRKPLQPGDGQSFYFQSQEQNTLQLCPRGYSETLNGVKWFWLGKPAGLPQNGHQNLRNK